MMSLIKVGMADLKVVRFPDGLTTLGLGSCVGICVYDPTTRIAGMAHIMLPSSKVIKNNSNEAKFADTAIAKLVSEMVVMGASRGRLFAKIAGGSQMFAANGNGDTMKVGQRNAEAVRAVLGEMRIPIRAEDTGGSHGRTIEFYTESGILLIKTIGHGVKKL